MGNSQTVRNIGILVTILLVLGVGSAAGNWESYGGGPGNTGLTDIDTSEVNGALLWTVEIGTLIYAPPVVDPDGIVYLGTTAHGIVAISSEGELLWTFYPKEKVFRSGALGPDGTIYFATADGTLLAIDSQGNEVWRYVETGGFDSAPHVHSNGNIIVVGPRTLYSIHPNGTLDWETRLTDGWSSFSVDSAPAEAPDGTIYILAQGTLAGAGIIAFAPNGTLLWDYLVEANRYGIHHASPAIGADGTIYFGLIAKERLYALRPDGTLRWSAELPAAMKSTPGVAADGTIYAGTEAGHLLAFSPAGQELWSMMRESAECHKIVRSGASGNPEATSSPAIGGDGTIYIGGPKWDFFAIGPDGKIKWCAALGTTSLGGAAIGPTGNIFVPTLAGLYALGAGEIPKEPEIPNLASPISTLVTTTFLVLVTTMLILVRKHRQG